jgi:flagellar biosynthesis component FlhA
VKSNNRLLYGIILTVLVLWASSAGVIILTLDDWSSRGTFGDLFGAINALFSGLALAGLVYSLYRSREELGLQREEIELNRKELIKSRKTQEKSEKALEEQARQLRAASKINGLKILIDYYTGILADAQKPEDIKEQARTRRRELIKEVDSLIDRLSDDELE